MGRTGLEEEETKKQRIVFDTSMFDNAIRCRVFPLQQAKGTEPYRDYSSRIKLHFWLEQMFSYLLELQLE